MNAIKDRSSGLTPRQRAVLIMCDGKRNSSEVLRNTTGLGSTEGDFAVLVSLQMVVSISPAASQAMAPPVVDVKAISAPALGSSAVPAAGRTVSPEELKIFIRRATKQLESLLGPSCEPLSLKLEKSKTYDEFAIKIHDIRGTLISIRSEKVADEFLRSTLA